MAAKEYRISLSIDDIADAISENIHDNNGLVDVNEPIVEDRSDNDPISAITEEMAEVEKLRASGEDTILPRQNIDLNRIRERQTQRDWEREEIMRLNRVASAQERYEDRQSSDEIRVVTSGGRVVTKLVPRPAMSPRPVPTQPVPAQTIAEEAPIPVIDLGQRKLML